MQTKKLDLQSLFLKIKTTQQIMNKVFTKKKCRFYRSSKLLLEAGDLTVGQHPTFA